MDNPSLGTALEPRQRKRFQLPCEPLTDMEQSELLIEPSNIEQSELCGLWTRVVCELTRIFVNLLW